MKILQVVGFFSPKRGGGVIAVVDQLSRSLSKRGHSVTIYTSDFELDQKYLNSFKGINIYPFPSHLKLGGRPLFVTGVYKQSREQMKEFDIIHMQGCRGILYYIVRYFALKHNIPYIVDAHGINIHKSGILGKLIDAYFTRRVLRDATMTIAETSLGVEELRAVGITDDKISILYPPFPVDDYSVLPSKGYFKNRYNIREKHILMFLGRINRIKGIEFLVSSFCEICKYRDDIILVVVGADDGCKDDLDNMIKSMGLGRKVLFTGYLSGKEKQSALVDADIVVQPSYYEQGLPWACIESLLCGTPIIVCKNTGASEDAVKMDTGYLVEYGNTPELIDTIQYILDNQKEISANVEKGNNYIKNNLSIYKKVEEYEKIYFRCK